MVDRDRTRLALEHIAEALDDIATLIAGVDRDGFIADRLKQRAVERCLEIVSEASRKLPADLKESHPTIPWRAIAGIGNVLRHDYDEVDPVIIWQAATVEIIPLRKVVDAIRRTQS